MELRSTREMRRNEQMARTTAAKKADAPDSPAKARSAQRADKCTLSRQALSYLEEQNRLTQELEKRRARQEDKWGKTRNKSGELDMLSKQMEMMEACMKIARSIMKGDKVPMKDLKFLMENDPAGYKLAMALRRNNPDPEEMDSVVEEMEKRHAGEGDSGGGEASQASAPAASSGGGTSSSGGGEASASAE